MLYTLLENSQLTRHKVSYAHIFCLGRPEDSVPLISPFIGLEQGLYGRPKGVSHTLLQLRCALLHMVPEALRLGNQGFPSYSFNCRVKVWHWQCIGEESLVFEEVQAPDEASPFSGQPD